MSIWYKEEVMRITTKGRYALNLMIDLADHNTGVPIRLRDIAQRQGISEKYLEKIISLLHRAGYVKSTRGAQGGYTLNRETQEYTVGMILRITEGSMAPVLCVEEGHKVCEKMNQCVTVLLWRKINDAVNEVIDTTTLQDLIDWRDEKTKSY